LRVLAPERQSPSSKLFNQIEDALLLTSNRLMS